MQLLDRKNQVPVFATNNITILNGKTAEFKGIQVFVVLWMWMRANKITNVHNLNSIVAEIEANVQIACILSSDDKNPFHNRLSIKVSS